MTRFDVDPVHSHVCFTVVAIVRTSFFRSQILLAKALVDEHMHDVPFEDGIKKKSEGNLLPTDLPHSD